MKKSGLSRVLDILDAFAQGEAVLSAEQIAGRKGLAMATCYRYIRDLCEAGLLVKWAGGYTPGPRIIEWDRMMRIQPPLLSHCHRWMGRLVKDTGLEFLVSQLYGDRVVNVFYEHNASNEPLLYDRGSVMPLFRGSTSRVILAHMPPRQLRRLYEANCETPEVRVIGRDWKAFNAAMGDVRRRGYAVSSAEVHNDKAGMAAPLFGPQGHILGSLTLIGSAKRYAALREDEISKRLLAAARAISSRLKGDTPSPHPPRAVSWSPRR